jgi:hypothetical protein
MQIKIKITEIYLRIYIINILNIDSLILKNIKNIKRCIQNYILSSFEDKNAQCSVKL